MRERIYLEPAHGVVRKFSDPNGKLSSGIKRVACIAGVDTTRVYRWMFPKERGGTGGIIPLHAQMKLFEHAKREQIPLSPSDFFGASAHEAA
jgi:hypothetical protein